MSQCGPSSRLAIRAPRQEKSLGLVARDAIPAAFDRRVLLVLCLGLTLTRCAAAPPPAPIPVLVSYEQKLAWILRLEDQRLLRDPALPDPEDPRSVEGEDPEPPPATGGDAASGVLSLLPSATPDLLRLIEDPSAAIRRRSAACCSPFSIS